MTGEEAAKEFGTKFAEVSALTGDGVEEVRNCPLICVSSEPWVSCEAIDITDFVLL